MPNQPFSPLNPVQPSDFMKTDIPAETDDLQLGQRGAGDMDVDGLDVAAAAQHEVDHRRLVDRRGGVRLQHDRGDAPGGGGARHGGQGLLMLGARFAGFRPANGNSTHRP